ncbi:AraC family transcriptional regulator [Kordia periserrulae]|uniref:AraC family transcriptional regulator n=1 Tax=Kordia periserrulae TaxID=701523 RepID=A0A2T6C6Q6_9FLAO|nr:helix-turn-helix domain-containing protein [Kordia periserrulae]PTX64000.1 AraC family transcriptional regulator [Kordia periserrulae]
MAVQDITTYSYQNTFSLSVVQFEKACVVNQPEQVDAYTIYWIKEGKGTYFIDFEEYTFDGTIIFFLSPGQVFTVSSEAIKEAYKLSFQRDFYCIQTHDQEISCNGVLFNNLYDSPYVIPKSKDVQRLQFLLADLREEFNHENSGQYDMLQSYLKQFIIHSVRLKKDDFVVKSATETQLYKDFSVLVEQNFRKMHSVSAYAARLGISPKSISKHFQKLGTITPSDFIKNRIILEAKRQLLYSEQSVKEIAFDLGFNDPAYFTRFFTKAMQKSPLSFKAEFGK